MKQDPPPPNLRSGLVLAVLVFSYILSNGYRYKFLFRLARQNVIYKAKGKLSLISGYAPPRPPPSKKIQELR